MRSNWRSIVVAALVVAGTSAAYASPIQGATALVQTCLDQFPLPRSKDVRASLIAAGYSPKADPVAHVEVTGPEGEFIRVAYYDKMQVCAATYPDLEWDDMKVFFEEALKQSSRFVAAAPVEKPYAGRGGGVYWSWKSGEQTISATVTNGLEGGNMQVSIRGLKK